MRGIATYRGATSREIRVAALAAIAGVAGINSVAHGAFVWDAGASPDNSWNNATNWDANSGVPTGADSARWTAAGSPSPSTVDIPSGGAAASDVLVDDRIVTFNLNNFALNVGNGSGTPNNIDGDNADATFHGPGSVSFDAPVQLGVNRPFVGGTVGHSRVTANGGANVTTMGLVLGRYRGGGIVTVDGAGTTWNNTRDVNFGQGSGDASYIYTQPRAQLYITNGAHFTHNTGANAYHTFKVANNSKTDTKIVVDGAGSQLNITGSYQNNFKVGGYGSSANSTWEFTNGGVFNSTMNLGMAYDGTGNHTFTISGTGSKMSTGMWGVGMRSSDAGSSRATATIVNVGTGGTLEATNFDGGNRGIGVADRAKISLQGGSLSVPAGKDVALRDTGSTTGAPATIEGIGTIFGGNLRVEANSIVRPGLSTGTLTIQDGSLTATSPNAQFNYELNTTDGTHDRISIVASGQSATIPGVFSYTNLGAGAGFTGTMDFLLADTITYAGTLTGGDIPLNTDNLNTILSSAGYTTRVTGAAPTNPGEYRYFIAPDVSGTSDALRVQLVGVPEPGSTAAIAAVASALLTRRRRRRTPEEQA